MDFQELFIRSENRENVVPEVIQSDDLGKIRSGMGDKKSSGVAAENRLNEV